MDQNQAIEKARQFARMRYTGETENILREHEQKRAKMRSQLAARGMAVSGATITESARIDGEQITAITHSRIDATLEGYELYGIEIDDQMAINMCDDIVQGMKQMAFNCQCPTFGGSSLSFGIESQYPRMVGQALGLSANLIKTQIDRRRLMARKQSSPTTNYYVQGENARVNVNSADHSANIVIKSSEEFFGAIRQRIESGIPDGERRKVIEALTALQESHGKASFAQRYTEFIGVAADYMTLLTPFIPQLTQMLGNVLK